MAFRKNTQAKSWHAAGAVRYGINLNYNELPASALEVVERNFLQEMEIVQPTHVISLGEVVQQTVRKLLPASVDCSMRLPHPSWITTYRGKEMDEWAARYLAVLEKFRQ
ncbi:MAG: hypothetical protein AABY81_03220 [Pseudomonadota bacterium]